MTDAQAVQPTKTGRRTAYIVVAVVLGVGIGLGTFAVYGLLVPWFTTGREVHRIHDIGWGTLGTFVLTVGLLSQVRPERAVGPLHAVLGALVGMLAAGLASASWLTAIVPVVAGLLLLLLHPFRSALRPEGGRVSIALAVLALVAAIPLLLYGLDQAGIQRACPPSGDPHCDEFHWSSMAALGFALPLAALGAAMRAPGWRLAAWLVGLATLVFGLSSVVFPDLPSSVGSLWGAVAIGGGAVFIAVAEWQARETPARHDR